MFELSQLRCFVAVAEDLHFGRAAARLNMTQPPLSRQVQLLEHALGIRLLARTSRSVALTPAGRAFLLDARRILLLADGAGLAAQRVARGEAGSITLGCTAAASYGLLPRLVAFATAAMPGIDLVLQEMVTAEQMEALASGRLDLGLVRQPFDRRVVESAPILREPLLLAVPQGHALAGGAEPAIADLDRQDFIMWSPVEARYFHDLITGLCAAAGAVPRHVQYISQTHTMLALVSAGLGLALVPAAARALRFEGVVLRPVRSRRPAEVELHAVWRRDATNPALPGFRDAILREFAPAPGRSNNWID
jgi:DNA-binding transcriptional LysR family regulator